MDMPIWTHQLDTCIWHGFVWANIGGTQNVFLYSWGNMNIVLPSYRAEKVTVLHATPLYLYQ